MFTRLIHNAQQAAGFRHTVENRGAAFICADCNEAIYFPIRADGGYSCGTGYAQPRDSDALICYPCADKSQIADLIGATRAGGYISSDGKRLTTWTGGTLGTVIQKTETALPFGRTNSWVHGKHYFQFRIRDVHGQYWHGKSSPGICITLRRLKGN